MGTPTFVTNGTVQTLATSASAPYPASLASGNLLLLHCASYDGNVTNSVPSGWTELSGSPFSGGGVQQARIYYKISTGSETGTVSITANGTKGHARMEQYAPAATETITILSAAATTDTNANASLSITSGTITAAPNDLLVSLGFAAGDFSLGAYTGFNITATTYTLGTLGTRGSGRAGTTVYQWCALDRSISTGTTGTFTTTATGNASSVSGIVVDIIVRSQASSLTPGYTVKVKQSGTFVTAKLRLRSAGTWTTPSSITAYHPGTPTTPTESRPNLPWDLQATYTPATPKWCMTHYVPWTPPSLDDGNPKALGGTGDYYDNNYLPPGSSSYSTYGGWTRDRAKPRAPRGSGYEQADINDELSRIADAKFDGVFIDFVTGPKNPTSRNWLNIGRFFNASNTYYAATGKRIYIMPIIDGKGSAARSTTTSSTNVNVTTSANEMADIYGGWLSQPGLWWYDTSGALTVPVYNPESWPSGYTNTVADRVTYWNTFKTRMKNVYNTDVKFLFCWVSDWNSTSTGAPSTLGALASILSRWGDRDDTATKAANNNNRNAPSYAHSQYGKAWCHYVAHGDQRPSDTYSSGGYRWWEQRGSRTFENTWRAAIDAGSNCEMIQQTTWNDYAEGAHIAPSPNHGYVWCDLNTYWLHYYKTGAAPTVQRDGLYLFHRLHTHGKTTGFTGPQSRFGLPAGSTAAVNEVEVLAFAKSAGTVDILVDGVVQNSTAVVVGMNRINMTLPSSGVLSARMTRSGSTVAGTTVTSNRTLGSSLVSDDYDYRAFSSLRQYTGT